MRHPDQPRPAGGDGIEGRDDALTHRPRVGVEPPVELHERGVDREEAPPVVHDDEAPSLVPLNLSLLVLLTLVRYTGGGATAIRRDYCRFAGLARDACERLGGGAQVFLAQRARWRFGLLQ